MKSCAIFTGITSVVRALNERECGASWSASHLFDRFLIVLAKKLTTFQRALQKRLICAQLAHEIRGYAHKIRTGYARQLKYDKYGMEFPVACQKYGWMDFGGGCQKSVMYVGPRFFAGPKRRSRTPTAKAPGGEVCANLVPVRTGLEAPA